MEPAADEASDSDSMASFGDSLAALFGSDDEDINQVNVVLPVASVAHSCVRELGSLTKQIMVARPD